MERQTDKCFHRHFPLLNRGFKKERPNRCIVYLLCTQRSDKHVSRAQGVHKRRIIKRYIKRAVVSSIAHFIKPCRDPVQS